MKETETIKNNMLIAVFMGKKLTERNGEPAIFMIKDAAYPEYFRVTKHNKYHEDWNMLIPVIDGICEIGIHNYGEICNQAAIVANAPICNSIEVHWGRVLKFIEWYNANTDEHKF